MSEIMSAAADAAVTETQGQESVEPVELTPEQYNQYKVKFKVSGQERAATLDEIIRQASLAEGARSKFDQAVTERKKAEALYRQAQESQGPYQELVDLLQQAKSNPKVFREVIRELGSDHLNEFITDYITERAQEERMSPEERKIREYEQKLAEYERQQQELKERQEQEKLQNRSSVIYNAISNEFADAISSAEGLDIGEIGQLPDSSPKKQSVYLAMERAIVLAQKQLEQYGQFDSLETLYKKGLSQIRLLSNAGREAALEELAQGKQPIPKDLAKQLSKQQIEALRKSQIGRQKATTPAPQRSSKTSKKPMTINDFFDRK